MSGLNKVLLAVLVGTGAYSLWGSHRQKLRPLPPLYQKPYVIVYGRESCGNCQEMREGLTGGGVPYVWKIIDEDPGRSEAFSRLQAAGIGTGNFMLPIVDVNAEILVHPEPSAVIAKYRP